MKKLTLFKTGMLLFSFFAVFLMQSCQKESIEQTSSMAVEENQHAFFDYDRMSKVNKNIDASTIVAGEPSEELQKIMSDFLEVEKEKPFADRLSKEIGYPIWNAYQSIEGADGENVKLIPIAKEDDNILTAYMIASEKDEEYKYKLVKKSNLDAFKVNEGENSLDYEYVLMTLAGLNELYFHEVDCSLKDNVKELITANLGTEKVQNEESADSRNCYYVPVWSQQCVSVSQNGMTLCCKCHSVVSYHYICNEVAVIVENGNDGTNTGGGTTQPTNYTLANYSKESFCFQKIGSSWTSVTTNIYFNWRATAGLPSRSVPVTITVVVPEERYNGNQIARIEAQRAAVEALNSMHGTILSSYGLSRSWNSVGANTLANELAELMELTLGARFGYGQVIAGNAASGVSPCRAR